MESTSSELNLNTDIIYKGKFLKHLKYLSLYLVVLLVILVLEKVSYFLKFSPIAIDFSEIKCSMTVQITSHNTALCNIHAWGMHPSCIHFKAIEKLDLALYRLHGMQFVQFVCIPFWTFPRSTTSASDLHYMTNRLHLICVASATFVQFVCNSSASDLHFICNYFLQAKNPCSFLGLHHFCFNLPDFY